MMNARTLHRRLEKLEAVLNILSTDDKWAIVHERAVEFMSDADLEALEGIAALENGSILRQLRSSIRLLASAMLSVLDRELPPKVNLLLNRSTVAGLGQRYRPAWDHCDEALSAATVDAGSAKRGRAVR